MNQIAVAEGDLDGVELRFLGPSCFLTEMVDNVGDLVNPEGSREVVAG